MSRDDEPPPEKTPARAGKARAVPTGVVPTGMRSTRTLKRPGEIKAPAPAPNPVPVQAPRAKQGAGKPAPEPKRQAAQMRGLSAESRAAAFLMAKGYRIIARRYKTPVGEIDVVAQRLGTVVFAEVKARASLDAAAESVSLRQRGRIVDAAQYWLAAHPQAAGLPLRFDVILIAPGCLPRHIQGAFDASD